MMLTSGLVLAITKRTTHLKSGLKLTRRCRESLKTKPVDNKLKRLLLCLQNHKSYSIKMYEDGKENKKCKGITKTVTKNTISHEDYRNTLFTWKRTDENNEDNSK